MVQAARSTEASRSTVHALSGDGLVGAVLAEQTDEWAEQRRYMSLDVLAKARADTTPSPSTAGQEVMPTPVLTA